jgi:hypothetical protein
MTDHSDFSVVVKNRGGLPRPWKFIAPAGSSPVEQLEVYSSSVAEASRAGRKALSLFLSEHHNEVPMQWPLCSFKNRQTGPWAEG